MGHGSTRSIACRPTSVSYLAIYHPHNVSHSCRFLSSEDTKSLVHAFITSRLDYCNSRLYGLPASHLNTIQRMILNATDSQVSVQSATLFSRNAFDALTSLSSDKTTSTF